MLNFESIVKLHNTMLHSQPPVRKFIKITVISKATAIKELNNLNTSGKLNLLTNYQVLY